MIETLSVSLSGPAFSFLLYENLKSNYSQEGFLLGELVEKETKSITDNDQEQVHIARTIKITCAVPCPHTCYFYNGAGRIDPDKIQSFLSDSIPKVVAWYKYKANSSLKLSFRETLVHKQLSQFFNLPPQFFSCCLLTSDNSKNCSTHSYTQTFMRINNQKYEEIPMHIVNLSDPSYLYKTPEQLSDTVSNIVNSLELDPRTSGGPGTVLKIQHALQKHTDQIVEQLSEAEERLFQLEEEVRLLRSRRKETGFTSASNNYSKEVAMETEERSPKKTRGRGRATPNPKARKNNQSPVKKEGIVTRSMKN